MTYARINPVANGLQFYSSYDPELIAELKSRIPATGRKWEPSAKCWLISPKYLNVLDDIVKDTLGVDLDMPANVKRGPVAGGQTKMLRVEYIGGLKDRGDGNLTAFGAILKKINPTNAQVIADLLAGHGGKYDLEWSVIFSESVLRRWFENSADVSVNVSTLYSVLATKPTATGPEIKAAWRKQVRRYHPDINRDADAADMTIKINEAYNILRNPQSRKRYDAGLKLEASLKKKPRRGQAQYWQCPVRCGFVLCEGHYEVGRFVVSKILEWQDIIENGRTLVTSWDLSTNSLVRNWI